MRIHFLNRRLQASWWTCGFARAALLIAFVIISLLEFGALLITAPLLAGLCLVKDRRDRREAGRRWSALQTSTLCRVGPPIIEADYEVLDEPVFPPPR